jgi:hypothetical protein
VGKRSDFERVERDFYPTPFSAVVPLSAHLTDVRGFAEPCCGDGQLIASLESLGHNCNFASDISPEGDAFWFAHTRNGLSLEKRELVGCSHIITNPPWPAKHGRGEPTLGLIRHFSKLRPTWLLLSADFAHHGYANEVLAYCAKIVSIGRVKWIEGSENTGKDNCAWYLFDAKYTGKPAFYGRDATAPVYGGDLKELL